jgi:multidrug efflux pump subunit AcrB
MIRFFAERHLVVNVLAITTVILAFYLSPSISREYLPSVDMPRVIITARLPGASARDVETKLTIPIQEAIEDVDGIDEYYTTISDSVSVTTVELYMDSTETQVLSAIQDLRDALDGISDFPPEMEEAPTLVRANPGKSAIIEIALAGPMDELAPLAEDLEQRIERLPGISRVTIVGLQDPEVRVLVDPMLAESHGVTLIDVVNAIQARNVSTTGATLEAADRRSQVIVWSRFEDPLDVGETVVASSSEGLVRARDIARIEATREDTGLIVQTNAQQGLSLIVRKREGGDAIEAVDAIRELMDATPLPPSVSFEYVNDITFFTRNRLEVMATNGVMGAVIVALILLAFMRRAAAVWVLVGIPVVFCGAIILLFPLGMTFNLFTLTGLVIVLGMVVDDAVVVSENIVTHQERGLSPIDAAVVGTQEMVKPVMAAAITTALAFGPIVAMGGIPGKVMWQIPAMVVLVLIFSLLESFFILPAHMSSMRAGKANKRAWVQTLEEYYRLAIRTCLQHRALVISAAFAALIFVMAVIQPRVDFVQFPQADARLLFLKIGAPVGTPLERTEALSADLQRQIQEITSEDFRAVTARIGHQDVDGNEKERGEAEHEALLTIVFKELDRRYTNQEWIQVLQRELVIDPRVHLTFQSEYVGPPTDQPVTLHVLANDAGSRRAAASEIADWVGSQIGITQLQVDERPGTPKLDLNLDHDKIAMLGLDARSVALAVQAAFFGIEASEHRDVDDTTELRVQLAPHARVNLDALLDTSVRSATGERVPLRDVVRPIETPGLDRIYHREGSRAATIRASFTPDAPWTAVSFAEKVRSELMPRFADQPNLELVIGGEAADTAETTGALGSVALLVVLAIAVVIWILLGSLLEALSVVIVIPFALAGVIIAFFIHGLQLSMPAVIGTIGLAGVVVNASIVMMDCVHRTIKNNDSQKSTREVVEDAVVSRLRPILITTLTTLGGVLPTAYGIGGYDQIVSPMSIAIGWGLLFSTIITLFVIPALFSVAHDATAFLNRIKTRLTRQELQ